MQRRKSRPLLLRCSSERPLYVEFHTVFVPFHIVKGGLVKEGKPGLRVEFGAMFSQFGQMIRRFAVFVSTAEAVKVNSNLSPMWLVWMGGVTGIPQMKIWTCAGAV